MSAAITDVLLGSEFPPAQREQWLALVDAVLKGRPFDKALVTRTYDGLRIEPLYPGAADARPVLRGAPAAPWQVLVRIDHRYPPAANAQALHDLANGATGLVLVFAESVGSYGFGLDASPTTLRRVLDEVSLDGSIALELDLDSPSKDVLAVLRERAAMPTSVRVGFDPLGMVARSGVAAGAWDEIARAFATLLGEFGDQGWALATADGRVIHDAGGSEAQELAYVLAVALAYMRALEAHQIALEAARRMIFFRLAADADQFLTIAKLRALRVLFTRVEDVCRLAPHPIFISAHTAWRMMTRRDPWVNILRATIATFAAGVGGADAITVLPFTAALGLPDGFARRLTRNTQLILLEEVNLAKVADPAAGSGVIEDLTQQLCATAWSLFQEIEAAGGAYPALATGMIQRKVAAVRARREAAVACGSDALTGTSAFPDIRELPVAVLDVAPIPSPPIGARLAPLAPQRLAEPFEALRDASDRVLTRTGSRPTVFLANLGTSSDFTMRATFAKNFFEAGGIEAISNDGFSNRDLMVAAFKASGAKLACLCSADEVYAAQAPAAARALSQAGAMHIYLVGRPDQLTAALTAAGVQDFVYAGADMLATLQAAHDILGMTGEAKEVR